MPEFRQNKTDFPDTLSMPDLLVCFSSDQHWFVVVLSTLKDPAQGQSHGEIHKVCPAQLETNSRGVGHPQRGASSSQREGEGGIEV